MAFETLDLYSVGLAAILASLVVALNCFERDIEPLLRCSTRGRFSSWVFINFWFPKNKEQPGPISSTS